MVWVCHDKAEKLVWSTRYEIHTKMPYLSKPGDVRCSPPPLPPPSVPPGTGLSLLLMESARKNVTIPPYREVTLTLPAKCTIFGYYCTVYTP